MLPGMQLTLGGLETGVRRSELGQGAWIDVQRGWWPADPGLFDRLLTAASWRAERRPMYDRVVDVPRLVAFYDDGQPWPDAALVAMADQLNQRYADELGEPLVSLGMCLYRDGRDSVAWHGDRIGKAAHTDTIVAIVSLGNPRTLAIRPLGGGTSRRFTMEHGDLVVMGGSCQRTFEHAVPKTARPTGARISLQFRAAGVR